MSQLGFDFGAEEPQKLAKVSPARLGTFESCPRRYRMAYLDRPTPKRGAPWAHSTLGAVVHNALRAFFELPVVKRTSSRAAVLVTEHWKDAGFADAEQSAIYRERARGWVSEYVERTDVTVEPVGLERWVSASVNVRTGKQANASIVIEGRADRIDERGAELVIIDYKTGRRVPDEDDARNSRALALYAIAAATMLRAPCHRVELHHVPTSTIAIAEHSPESLLAHLTGANETAQQLQGATDTLTRGGEADALFPVRPGSQCTWCDFRPSCSAGQEAAPAVPSWQALRETHYVN